MDEKKNEGTVKAVRVTRELLKGMAAGETLTVELPDAAAIESGKASAYQLQRIEGCKFRMSSDYVARTLTITRTEP